MRTLADLGFLLGIALGLVLLTPFYAFKRLMRPAGAHPQSPAGHMGVDPERGTTGGSVRGAGLAAAYDRPDSFANRAVKRLVR